MTLTTVTISHIWEETPDIRCLALRPDSGTIRITPGAHLNVHLTDGIIRQYSIWNGPEDTDAYLIGVKLDPQSRGGSVAMHALREGDRIQIGAPLTNFTLVPSSRPALLLAGGIGITPLLSMARHLAAGQHAHTLHLFVRGLDHVPFRKQLEALPDAPIHIGLAPPVLGDMLAGLLQHPTTEAHLYLCGPGPFMDLIMTTARATGWPADRIHLERFSVAPITVTRSTNSFNVVLKRSGKTVHVPENQTIVEALEAVGVNVLTSCEQGVCGTCLTRVLKGTPDHRDQYLSSNEQATGESMMICVSRCKHGPLVLDL
ncbi:MAG: PDR/VanB family oxidoreductase [Aestuariivita sp.]|nr:PDR/VanB family oxidoreductase [Aestuariivita sp.]